MASDSPEGLAAAAPGAAAPRFAPELMHAAATLYYVEEANQAEIAARLGVSRATVSRLLAEARRSGIVRIEVVAPAVDDAGLADRVADALGLRAVYVAPPVHEAMVGPGLAGQVATALRDVGLVRDDVLLVSSGRTVWDVAQADMPALPGVIVAPTVGGHDEPEPWYQTNEITRQMAHKVQGHPVFVFAPALPSQQLHERLVTDPALVRVMDLWESARCALLGVGAPPAARQSMPSFVPREAPWLREAVGDICVRFYDRQGVPLSFPGSDWLVATSHETLQRIPVSIAVAVGAVKAPALVAGARARWFNTLVTDAPTAEALLAVAADGVVG